MEANNLVKTQKQRIAMQFFKNAINYELEDIERKKPFFYQNCSEKLQKIIEEYNRENNIDTTIKNMELLSENISNIKNKPSEYSNQHLQNIFEIISENQYLKTKLSKSEQKDLVKKIVEIIKKENLSQIKNNPGITSIISINLKKMMKNMFKNDENYFKKEMEDFLKKIIDNIKNEIKINDSSFNF